MSSCLNELVLGYFLHVNMTHMKLYYLNICFTNRGTVADFVLRQYWLQLLTVICMKCVHNWTHFWLLCHTELQQKNIIEKNLKNLLNTTKVSFAYYQKVWKSELGKQMQPNITVSYMVYLSLAFPLRWQQQLEMSS